MSFSSLYSSGQSHGVLNKPCGVLSEHNKNKVDNINNNENRFAGFRASSKCLDIQNRNYNQAFSYNPLDDSWNMSHHTWDLIVPEHKGQSFPLNSGTKIV